jgi:hypothetical protein
MMILLAEKEVKQQSASVMETCRFQFFFPGMGSCAAADAEADGRDSHGKGDIAVSGA